MTNAFDIIGDVHGQFDKLVELLSHMGYSETGGAWQHPSRKAIFVGDLIDRGPEQLATINLVRRAGSAQSVTPILADQQLAACIPLTL